MAERVLVTSNAVYLVMACLSSKQHTTVNYARRRGYSSKTPTGPTSTLTCVSFPNSVDISRNVAWSTDGVIDFRYTSSTSMSQQTRELYMSGSYCYIF